MCFVFHAYAFDDVMKFKYLNPFSANPTKWSSTLKQFVGNLRTNCLSVFDHFVKLALKGLKVKIWLSEERNELSNIFTFSQVLFFRHTKQTSKNLADTTYK